MPRWLYRVFGQHYAREGQLCSVGVSLNNMSLAILIGGGGRLDAPDRFLAANQGTIARLTVLHLAIKIVIDRGGLVLIHTRKKNL